MPIDTTWMQNRSHEKDLSKMFAKPFPVGTEYYRPPTPQPQFWDEDFRRIRAAGMSIVRAWYSWNWVETLPNHYEFDDLDLLFELAAKHGLKVWVDTTLGTHMACPAWMLRQHPDMRTVWRDGSIQQDRAGEFSPHGSMTHNFDHSMWRVYVERYLNQIVPRYKDHPAMGIWGTWDGIGFAAAWTALEAYPPYNDYTIAKYKDWLFQRFSLDQLNERLLRRYRSWEDVDAPRSKEALVEMHLYLQFHYENMADHLGWMANLVDTLDGTHEQRSHGGSYPAPRHEIISPVIDSWGLSHHSANRLTTDEPYSMAYEAYGFQWCRAIGRNNRWWNEEIYSSFVGGLKPTEKMTLGEESALYIWLTLIEGGAGAMFWQYRPEYMTFEAPGLNIAALDGEPTERLQAAAKTIAQIDTIAPHLPLSIPTAPMAIAYSGPSDDQFDFNGMGTQFIQRHRALYRALWQHSVPMDLVTPAMDWSAYGLVYLPNFAVLDDAALTRLRGVLQAADGPKLVADGYFGTFSGKGHWSFKPPEGLSDLIDCRIADFDVVNEFDVRAGKNTVKMECGTFELPASTTYAILEPRGDTRPIATIGDRVVGVRSGDGRFTWFSFTLSATASTLVTGQPGSPAPVGLVHDDVALAMLDIAGIDPWFKITGDRVVAFRRTSKQGGSLVFLLNLEDKIANTRIQPQWNITTANDLLQDQMLPLNDGAFELEMTFGEVRVIHCADAL
jgi:hypothetical protein